MKAAIVIIHTLLRIAESIDNQSDIVERIAISLMTIGLLASRSRVQLHPAIFTSRHCTSQYNQESGHRLRLQRIKIKKQVPFDYTDT